MNKRLLILGSIPALLLAGVVAQASEFGEHALEPSINGGVSATGLFASQAEEDRYFARREALADSLKLEPCINGAVSARGLFPTQAEADQWLQRMAGG
jgi:hypothetical protein